MKKDCTFKPQIQQREIDHRRSKSQTFEDLYTDSIKRKENQKRLEELKEIQELTAMQNKKISVSDNDSIVFYLIIQEEIIDRLYKPSHKSTYSDIPPQETYTFKPEINKRYNVQAHTVEELHNIGKESLRRRSIAKEDDEDLSECTFTPIIHKNSLTRIFINT